jgi:hypothetical protein
MERVVLAEASVRDNVASFTIFCRSSARHESDVEGEKSSVGKSRRVHQKDGETVDEKSKKIISRADASSRSFARTKLENDLFRVG